MLVKYSESIKSLFSCLQIYGISANKTRESQENAQFLAIPYKYWKNSYYTVRISFSLAAKTSSIFFRNLSWSF